MQNILKLFGAKDSVLFEKRFNRSLIILTLIYSITLGVILFISATFSYSIFSSRVGARFERLPQMQQLQVPVEIEIRKGPTVNEVREELVDAFIRVNGALFILAVIGSYFLARITLRPLKDAYEDQRRFIADASHELRTPLSVMHIELENDIAETQLKKHSTDKLESQLEEVNRMSKIVEDLLYLSKLESSQTIPRIQVVNMSHIIENVIKRLQVFADTKKVQIVYDNKNSNIEVKANDQISHVFSNVIKNAILYNKENGTVTVSLNSKKNSVDVKVQDTGIGIGHIDLKHIFDRFYRADKSRSKKIGGSGLGLSIAQQIVESNNGTIHIESELDKGTVVTINLPKA